MRESSYFQGLSGLVQKNPLDDLHRTTPSFHQNKRVY